MRVPRIFQDLDLAENSQIELGRDAAHHLTRVLKLRHEEQVILFNGKGADYSASLIIDGKRVYADIHSCEQKNTDSHLSITLMQGISKGDRMDIAIQKAVELGVSRIVPVISERTVVNLNAERMEKKIQHWSGIIINACEQSGRTTLPKLHNTLKLNEAVQYAKTGNRLILSPYTDTHLKDMQNISNQFTILIGPEGGLSDSEVDYALQNDFTSINLGPRILRTETAALATITAIQTLWGDLG